MRKLIPVCLILTIACSCAQAPKKPERLAAPPAARIQDVCVKPEDELKNKTNQLLKQLASSKFNQRETAHAELAGLLETRHGAALALLLKAHETTTDAEVKNHLEQMLAPYTRWQITPAVLDSIPDIAQLLYEDELKTVIIKLRKLNSADSERVVLSVTESLIRQLKDSDWRVRKTAAKTLGEIGDRHAVKALIDALECTERDTGSAAAEALGKIGAPRAIPPLVKALYNRDDTTCLKAVEALGKIGEPAVAPLIERLKSDDDWHDIPRALAAIGKPAVESLIPLLKDKNESTREKAAAALGGIKDKRAVQPLIDSLRSDKNHMVRSRAALALGCIGEREAVMPLISALQDDREYWVRSDAAQALGMTGSRRAVEPLIEALKEDETRVCSLAAEALGEIRDGRAIDPLIAALEDKNEGLRCAAARALGKIHDFPKHRAFEPLVNALKDKEPMVRWTAVESLAELYIETAVEPIIGVLKDKEQLIRNAAIEALGIKGCKKAVAPLIEAFTDPSEMNRFQAAESLTRIGSPAVQPLIHALTEKDSSIRWRVIWTLGRTGDKRAIGPLRQAWMNDSDEKTRFKAALALALLEDSKAFDFLVSALGSDDRDIRESAVRGLGETGQINAIKPLLEMLRDEYPRVQDAAKDALEVITEQTFGWNYQRWRRWWEKHQAQELQQKER